MTAASHRYDESPKERTLAVLLSILIHLLLIGIIAWVLTLSPSIVKEEVAEEEPMEITIVPPEPVKPTVQFIRTNPNAATEEVPKNAAFESDINTLAASETAPSGAEALPSVDGREGPTLELTSQDYSAGAEARPATPAQESQAQEEAPKPVPKPTPAATTQLALIDVPLKKPDPTPPAETKPQTQATRPIPPSKPGYQPETRVTRIRGNISNRGKASVESVATPLGRYKKMVSDAIGSRWYYYVNSQIGLLNIGTVSIRFTVDSDGKVKNLKVLSNTSNESFASVSTSAIIEAEIPPIPPDVASLLENNRIEIDYSFTILSN